jgi:ABC-type amino acid transport substrate-binding protein
VQPQKELLMVRIFIAACWASLVLATTGVAAPMQGGDDGTLVVGTKEAPPFSMRDAEGNWIGLSISVWEQAATRAGLTWRFEERDLDGLIEGLQDGSLDASVAALTMTAQREVGIDFTHPFHTGGLGIAVRPVQTTSLPLFARGFPYLPLLRAMGVLILLLFLAGLVLWLFERPRNREQFRGGLAGMGDAFWWSAVTLTTVGYGDKAPRTTGGRAVAVVWMFLGVFIISAFTATIASLMTAERLGGQVRGVEDLPRVRVATVNASTGEAYLQSLRIGQVAFPTVEEALDALATGGFDAVVHDAPILSYLVGRDHRGRINMLPHRFRRQSYGIGLPQGSPLRERMNRAILEVVSTAEWNEVLRGYLGD